MTHNISSCPPSCLWVQVSCHNGSSKMKMVSWGTVSYCNPKELLVCHLCAGFLRNPDKTHFIWKEFSQLMEKEKRTHKYQCSLLFNIHLQTNTTVCPFTFCFSPELSNGLSITLCLTPNNNSHVLSRI